MKWSRVYGAVLCWTVLWVALAGCQKVPVRASHWALSSGPLGVAAVPLPEALRVDAAGLSPIKIGGETVVARRATYLGASIADSWIKNVKNARGEVIYADGRIYDSISERVKKRVAAAAEKKTWVLEVLKNEIPALASSPWVMGPELELSPRPRLPGWRLLWVVDFFNRDEEAFIRLQADTRGRILWSRPMGSHLVDASATVFPKGPKDSLLSEVWLRGLLGNGNLESPKLKVTSTDAPMLLNFPSENFYRYPLEDHRFDAVQAYFYADQALEWFKNNAAFELPFGMTVDIFAGGLEHPRNTACYYYGIIRLGVGDGVTYQDLSRDASVVTHEVSHAVIDTVAHLPTDGEGGALNEAFADFFAAHILDNPRMGEVSYLGGPFRRTLENDVSLSMKNGGIYHDSAIVSGALWDIRKALGADRGFELTLKTLARMNTDSTFSSFKTSILLALQDGFGAEEGQKVCKILTTRGWSCP